MRNNTKEVKICDFGKALGITDIVEKVEYVRGDHNTKGDEKGDHVIITLKDEKDIIKAELEKAFKNHYKTVEVKVFAGEDDKWIEYNVSFKDDINEEENKMIGSTPIIEQAEKDVIDKFGLSVRSVHTNFVILEDRKNDL